MGWLDVPTSCTRCSSYVGLHRAQHIDNKVAFDEVRSKLQSLAAHHTQSLHHQSNSNEGLRFHHCSSQASKKVHTSRFQVGIAIKIGLFSRQGACMDCFVLQQ